MIDFIILFPIVWFFERKRPGVDGWAIASCVAVPAILGFFVTFGFAAFEKTEIGGVINFILFPTVLGVCLWLILGLPVKRVFVYVFGYLAVSVLIGVGLASLGVINAS